MGVRPPSSPNREAIREKSSQGAKRYLTVSFRQVTIHKHHNNKQAPERSDACFVIQRWFSGIAQPKKSRREAELLAYARAYALHISPVSIVDRCAVCSETTFSREVFWGSYPQTPAKGYHPLTPQGAVPLDPASLRACLRLFPILPLTPASRFRWQ